MDEQTTEDFKLKVFDTFFSQCEDSVVLYGNFRTLNPKPYTPKGLLGFLIRQLEILSHSYPAKSSH